jgi:Cu(I)/Ag(I) efflux system membrane fusion protein
LQFSAPNREPQLMVPTEAVIQTGERSIVVVVNKDGSFGVANVTTGGDADGRTAILAGLSEGQPIVLSGQFLIDSEASLKSAVTRLGAAGEATSAPAMSNDASPASQVHAAEGKITAIDDSSITLEHGAVPSLDWPPMTMGFRKPAQGAPPELKVGDQVEFSFKQVEGGFQIESIAKSGGTSDHSGHRP